VEPIISVTRPIQIATLPLLIWGRHRFDYPGVKAVVGSERKDEFKFSLRTEDLRADVSRLAALMGGGGHIKAASFSTPKSALLQNEKMSNE
jgi:hypothetical protein